MAFLKMRASIITLRLLSRILRINTQHWFGSGIVKNKVGFEAENPVINT